MTFSPQDSSDKPSQEQHPESPIHEQQPETTQKQRYATLKVTPAANNTISTKVLLGITISIFVLQILSQFLDGVDWPAVWGMKVNDWIIQGEVWRLITPVFLHGSIIHLAFNMYALHIFGSGLERHYGHLRFLMLYFLSAYAGNVASFLLSPNPSLGASTAIFGLVAAEGIFIYRNRFLFGKNARSMLLNVLSIVAINLFLGLSPGIDNWGHLGGLIGGFFFAWFAGPSIIIEGAYPVLTARDKTSKQKSWHVTAIVFLSITLLALSYSFFQ